MTPARHCLDDALVQLRKLKEQADTAVAQVDDRQLFAVLDPEANSIALIMKHLAGNMRSRWTDFLTSDGEKPDRGRDNEFLVRPGDTRAAILGAWEDGWTRAFDAISQLTEADVLRTVHIRGQVHTVLEAINRQVVHYAAHVGQIVLLAKHYAGPRWRTLSIPRGRSEEFTLATPAPAWPSHAPATPAPGAAAAAGQQTPPGDEEAWRHFLAFLKTAPALPGPQEILHLYGRTLGAEGLEPAAIKRRIGTLMAMMRRRSDVWPLMFDRIYATGAPNVVERPNPLLMTAVDDRPPGRALEIAVGHGRNAVALAARGWDVTGIDVSKEGLLAAAGNAERAGVRLSLRQETDETFDFGDSAWDLVAVIYGPVAIADAAYAARLHRSVRPGGLVVVESFASDRMSQGRRPVDIDPADLRHAFDTFRIVRFEDVDGVSEWDPQPARLVRLVAQRM
jgi:SAM-dependent methyltransferase